MPETYGRPNDRDGRDEPEEHAALASPLSADAGDEEVAIERSSLSPVGVAAWERRLSRREKLRRGTVIGAALVLVIGIIYGPSIASTIAASRPRPAPVTAHWNRVTTVPGLALGQLGDWQALPIAAADNQPLTFTPAPTDPSTVYACGFSTPRSGGAALGALHLWRTHDAGKTWETLALPRFLTNQCDLRIAADAAGRITLLATNSGCQSYAAYFSHDNGQHWAPLTLPYLQNVQSSLFECQLFATARHLYLWYAYQDPARAYSDQCIFLRSDDDGQTWTSISAGLPAAALFHVVATTRTPGGDDAFLASTPTSTAGSSAVLWRTDDAGRSWQHVGTLPGNGTGAPLDASHGDLSPSSQPAPLYANVSLLDGGPLYDQSVFATRDGSTWNPLPPLPVPGASPAQLGIVHVIGAAPDGRLYAVGVDPGASIPPSLNPSPETENRWIWVWDPSAGRWSVLPNPLPDLGLFSCQVLCWRLQLSWGAAPTGSGVAGQGTYLWAETLPHDGNVLLRVFLPTVVPGSSRVKSGAVVSR